MKIRFPAAYRYRDFKKPLFFGVLGLLVLAVLGCAGLQKTTDPSQDIRLGPGQSRSGTVERVDFAMNYRLFHEPEGTLQIDAQIFRKMRLAELAIWMTAYDAAGRSLETYLVFRSSYRTGYKGHGETQIDRTFPTPVGMDHIAFTSLATRKESR